jgi:adenylate cyclase
MSLPVRGRSRRLDLRHSMRPDAAASSAAESALADAERKGFRLAVIGRTIALVAFALFYLAVYNYPNNVYVAGAILINAAIGMIPLLLVHSGYERIARFVLLTFDAATVSAILAFAPLSAGYLPQNLVFVSSRSDYYYIVVAASVLSLSPALVLWTGLCAVLGLAGATAWIMSGMERIVSPEALPSSASREDDFAVFLSPDFFSIPIRVNEGVVIGLVTCIVALAVHRARNVVRANATAEAERARIQQIFGRYVPPQVAEQLVQAGQLAPQQRTASILFADIEGFTRLSETLPPPRVIGMLNSFFSAATSIVDERGGGEERHTYTLYGDTVYLAQRLELLNKEFETDCLISSSTFEAARSTCVDAVAMGSVQVRGRESAVEVFALGGKLLRPSAPQRAGPVRLDHADEPDRHVQGEAHQSPR